MRWPPKEIVQARNAMGWNQTQLAQALGVSRKVVSNWETGINRPNGHNLDTLDRVLADAPRPAPDLGTVTGTELLGEIAKRLDPSEPHSWELLAELAPLLIRPDETSDDLPEHDLEWPRRRPTPREDPPDESEGVANH